MQRLAGVMHVHSFNIHLAVSVMQAALAPTMVVNWRAAGSAFVVNGAWPPPQEYAAIPTHDTFSSPACRVRCAMMSYLDRPLAGMQLAVNRSQMHILGIHASLGGHDCA